MIDKPQHFLFRIFIVVIFNIIITAEATTGTGLLNRTLEPRIKLHLKILFANSVICISNNL